MKSASGKYKFGVAHSATLPLLVTLPLGGETEGNNKRMILPVLDKYFDNIAAMATHEKAVLEELVTNLTTLTTINAEMVYTIQ